MADAAEPEVSWLDIAAHAPVIANDGVEVGHVVEVAALPAEDIFHGVVFAQHRHHRLAPAADIARITASSVHLSVDSETAGRYDDFHELHISRLGLRGIFNWKHVTWKDASE